MFNDSAAVFPTGVSGKYSRKTVYYQHEYLVVSSGIKKNNRALSTWK